MAFPTLVIDSATGSDTQASGAGPATALHGTTGVSASDGLSVDLSADAPTLSGVATDGTAVLYFADANAGSLNFAKITGVNNTTKVVTVAAAVRASQTKAWAIGGRRASLDDVNTRKLMGNNGSAVGDADGWVIQLASGHSETITSSLTGGGGPSVTLQGEPGAATLPLLTGNFNGLLFDGYRYSQFQDFEVRSTSGTKGSNCCAFGAVNGDARGAQVRRIKASHANGFYSLCNGASICFDNCWVANHSYGIIIDRNGAVRGCLVTDCTNDGIKVSLNGDGMVIVEDCIAARNGGAGIYLGGNSSGLFGHVKNVTCHANTGDGIKVNAGAAIYLTKQFQIINAILSSNGGYGFSSVDSLSAAQMFYLLRNCCFHANTSGKYTPANLDTLGYSVAESVLDPQFTDAALDDFTIGTNLKALGWPSKIGLQ